MPLLEPEISSSRTVVLLGITDSSSIEDALLDAGISSDLTAVLLETGVSFSMTIDLLALVLSTLLGLTDSSALMALVVL